MNVRLGERLRALAAMRKTSPTELGTAADLSSDTVNKWIRESEGAEKTPGKIADLMRLADHYNVSLDWLTGRSGSPETDIATPPGAPVGDMLAMVREAAAELASHTELSQKEAFAEFFDLPAKAYKGAPWTALRMFRWALDRSAQKDHAAGRNKLAEPPGKPPSPPPRSKGPGVAHQHRIAEQGSFHEAPESLGAKQGDEDGDEDTRPVDKGSVAKKKKR